MERKGLIGQHNSENIFFIFEFIFRSWLKLVFASESDNFDPRCLKSGTISVISKLLRFHIRYFLEQ